jgi:hypothetical protein
VSGARADAGAPGPPPAQAVADYLPTRRWSGARGGALELVGMDAVPMLDAPPVTLYAPTVRVAGGAPYRLLLPLAFRPADDPALPPRSEWVAEHVRGPLYDATAEPAFRAALVAAVRDAAPLGPAIRASRCPARRCRPWARRGWARRSRATRRSCTTGA